MSTEYTRFYTARERAGLSRPELAKLLGAKVNSVAEYELGNHTPKSAALVRTIYSECQIIQLLGCALRQ